MMSQMEDMETLRKSDFARRFLNGLFATEDEFLAAAESISLNVDTALFAVAIIAKPLDTDYELTVDKVNHLFEGEVSGVARSLDMQGRIVVVVFANEQKALTDCVSMKLMGMRACCPGVTMAVSACHEDFRTGSAPIWKRKTPSSCALSRGTEAPLHFVATDRTVRRGHAGLSAERRAAANRPSYMGRGGCLPFPAGNYDGNARDARIPVRFPLHV